MRVDFIGWTVLDVNHAAVGLPPRNTRGIVVVGVSNAAVMLFFVFVFLGIRRGVAPQPELLHKLLALLVGFQPLERLPFLVSDDVADILIQPFLPRTRQFLFQRLLFAGNFFFGQRFGVRLCVGSAAAGARLVLILRDQKQAA